ncbi:MAG: sulfatase [Verrucomicrobiales bacterium]|nr:sulfatase [Verrucomicrobiales bacterium]
MQAHFFRLVFLLLLGVFPAFSGDRPNILFAFADDWGRYASAYREVEGGGTANDLLKTPHFDRIAKEGVLFKNAHVTSPSCTPCRSSLLSGQYFFRTGQAAILQGAFWDMKIPSFPLLLRDKGYHIGKVYKVWSPGDPRDAPFGEQKYGYETKGPNFNGFSQTVTQMVKGGKSVEEAKGEMLAKVGREFESFLEAQPEDAPFFFWFGPTNVHRKWIQGSGKDLWGLNPDDLKGKMPSFLPDVPIIREDFADYLGEAMAFDAGLGVLLKELEKRGELDNTLVVVSGDHGAPGFPRGKCNLYDFGTNVALAARWGNGKIPAGRVVDDFVNLMDLAPTFLEAGGAEIPSVMTGRSVLDVFQSGEAGLVDKERTWLVTGRERHVASARTDNLPYPQRAIRTEDHLYIVNFKPDRWPMGIPGPVAEGNVPSTDVLTNETFVCFGDLDASPTKAWMIENRDDPKFAKAYELGFGKRPGKELYVIAEDPDQVNNRAGDPALADVEKALHERLMAELRSAKDPRVTQDPVPYEGLPFTSAAGRKPKKK